MGEFEKKISAHTPKKWHIKERAYRRVCANPHGFKHITLKLFPEMEPESIIVTSTRGTKIDTAYTAIDGGWMGIDFKGKPLKFFIFYYLMKD